MKASTENKKTGLTSVSSSNQDVLLLADIAINSVLPMIAVSDEPEPEFSSSSRAELWRFRAEPSWGTSISELKPSWNFFDLREFSMNFQRSFNEFSWTFRLFNEFSWNFWFFKEFSWNFQLFRFAIHWMSRNSKFLTYFPEVADFEPT